MKINEKLILLRKEQGLTQQNLAKQINYSDKVISKWENGYSIPDLQALKILADFYKITIEELIGECDMNAKVQKSFPTLPKILLHIILNIAPIFLMCYILSFFGVKGSVVVIATWDAILPISIGWAIVVLSIIDLVFVYANVTRKVVVILIFSGICLLFTLALIAFAMYGATTMLTLPFIFFSISIVVTTAFGFITNRKC